MTQPKTPEVFGPYAAVEDTLSAPMLVAIRELVDRDMANAGGAVRLVTSTGIKVRHLHVACHAYGVDLAAFDDRILIWLAGRGATTVQVLIGMLSRAHAAGFAAGRAPAGNGATIAAAENRRHEAGS